MTAYEELLEFGGERIFDFLKNARLHESQFKYSEFNEVCYKKMYIENNQDSIKTVKELKEEIPELKDTCKGCGSYFMNPRNKSIKGLYMRWGAVDIQTLYLITFVEQLRLMQPRQQDVFVMETKILQHWFILRYITKRASRDSVNTLLVDLMLMVVKEKKIQII